MSVSIVIVATDAGAAAAAAVILLFCSESVWNALFLSVCTLFSLTWFAAFVLFPLKFVNYHSYRQTYGRARGYTHSEMQKNNVSEWCFVAVIVCCCCYYFNSFESYLIQSNQYGAIKLNWSASVWVCVLMWHYYCVVRACASRWLCVCVCQMIMGLSFCL